MTAATGRKDVGDAPFSVSGGDVSGHTPLIPTLTTERLVLRALALADFPALSAFYAGDRSRFVGGPLTEGRAWRALAAELGHWHLRGFGRFAIEERATRAFVGITGPWFPVDFPEHELGWDLMDGFTGRGYATEAAGAARAWAYGTLGWTTVISLVAPGNDASASVARRLGARPDGVFQHPTFGAMTKWRHPGPDDLPKAAS